MTELIYDRKREAFGAWWFVCVDNRPTVQASCPECGGRAQLDHRIEPDGTVSPSLACPTGCGFHDDVKLADWPSRTD